MTLTDDEVRAIDEAARVLRRVAQERGEYAIELFVRADGRANLKTPDVIAHADLIDGGAHPTPGEALRRLVSR